MAKATVRALFLLLLLANVLFLAWTQWVEVPAAAQRSATTGSAGALQPIRLQREVTGAPSPATTGGETAGNALDVTAAACVSAGPFATQAQAAAASADLQRLGFTSHLRKATDDVRVGTWVRVEDLATPEDANNALVALHTAGLHDAYVLNEGGPGTTVSVGVYADPHRAEEVAQAVTRAGFTPQASDRRRTLDVVWLDIDRQSNGGLPSLDALGPPVEGGLPLELRACPGPATGSVR